MRVTARGVGLFLGGVVLVVTGLWFGYRELAIVGCGALIAFTAALVVALRRWTLEVTRHVAPQRVSRGETCQGVVAVRNYAKVRGLDVVATDRCDLPAGLVHIPVPMLRIDAGRKQTVHYALPTSQRGVIEVGPLVIERRDLFDLVRSARDFGGVRQVWVHPTVHPLQAIPAGTARSLDGRVDKVEYGSIVFHALREYVPGDDLRHVHWRTSARVGTLMVREHVDTSLPRIIVLLDDRAAAYGNPKNGYSPAFEAAVEVAASVTVAALRENLALDLHTTSEVLLSSSDTTSGHASGVQAFLDVLAEEKLHETPTGGEKSPNSEDVELRAKGVLHDAAQALRQRRVGDTLVVLTGVAGAAHLDAIAQLRDVFPSIVCGIFESPAPEGVSGGRDNEGAATSKAGGEQGQHSGAAAEGRSAGMSSEFGALIIRANSAQDFATVWDGVRTW